MSESISEKSKIVPNTFQTPNILTDHYMQYLTGDEVKCYLTVVRKTLGWQKRTDHISASQISSLTGISENGVKSYMKSLVFFGMIIRVSENDPSKNHGIEWALQMDDTLINIQVLQERQAKQAAINAAKTQKMRAHKINIGGDVAHGGGGDVAHAPQKPLSKATINILSPDGDKPSRMKNRQPGGTDAIKKGDIFDGIKAFQSPPSGVDFSWLDEYLIPRALAFWQETKITPMPDERSFWRKELRVQYEAGITVEQIKTACQRMRKDGLTIKSPASIRAVAKDIQANPPAEPKPLPELPPAQVGVPMPAEIRARLNAILAPKPEETEETDEMPTL